MIIYHQNTAEGVQRGHEIAKGIVYGRPLTLVALGYEKHNGVIYEIMGEMWWN